MEREKLLSSTNKYKQALEGQISDLKENAVKVGIQALVFGGVALGTYLLVRAFQKKPTPQAVSPSSSHLPASTTFTSTLFASIQSYIISFLLSIARERIMNYLESYLLKQNEASSKN